MSGPKPSLRWHWLPIVVLLIGIVSIVLLFGVDRIRVRQGINAAIVSKILHIQVAAESYHLNVDEYMVGDPTADVEKALAGLDASIRLADSILNGPDAKRGLFAKLSTHPDLKFHIEEIKGLLIDFRRQGLELIRRHDDNWLGSQEDRRFHGASKEIFQKTTLLEQICIDNSADNQRRSHNFFKVILSAWSFILFAAITGLWSIELRRKRADESLLEANRQLSVQTDELTRHRENLAEIVVRRTEDLTTANEQLRLLSSRLLTAQELERHRISRELHDELGQALNVTKLRVRAVEKRLKADQPTLREDCEQLLNYLDTVIEDVRRLSLDLSPTILDDLGLTAAIRWLMGNLARIPSVQVTANIEEIDRDFYREHWITIYRVVQEALTNIGRHAEAENVAVSIRRGKGKAVFLIEDDGKGFDPVHVSVKDAAEKGLGLVTMKERIRMLGGVLDIRSSAGKGCRIYFTIPVDARG